MEFPITGKFRMFETYLNFNDVDSIKNVNIEKDDIEYLDRIAKDAINDFTRLGYDKIEERYLDILNIDTFHFHTWLEIDGYASQIEFNIGKVYSNFSLIKFDEKLWFDGQSEQEKDLWKTFRSFDTRPEIGDGKMAVFSIQQGVSPPNEPAIYYIDRASCWKTSLTFVQYYEAVLDMMGIADWQLLFTDVSWNDPKTEDYYQGLKESLEALAKAFPDKDYSKYFELLEARCNNL